MKFERPQRFELYRANPQGLADMHVLILSDDVPNALRSVVVACALDPAAKELALGLPTYVLLPRGETGLDYEAVASLASPFTLPKNALVERLFLLPRKAQQRVDGAIRLVFGYEEWPV